MKLKNSHKGVFHSSPSFQKAYLTDMLQEIVDSKIIVDPIITKGLWMEIDTTEDLKRAENLFKKDTKLVFPLTEFTTHIV